MVNLDEIVKRLLKVKGLSQGKEAAVLLGISAADLSNRKKRGTLLPLLVEWGLKEKVDMHWFITGEKMRPLKDAFYEELEEWARETGGSKNTAWLKNQIESFFPMFKEWRKRREEGEENKSGFPSSKVA